jgi:hypothetical protein
LIHPRGVVLLTNPIRSVVTLMTENAALSHEADGLQGGGACPARLLDRLNRTVDRLFGFELQEDELRHLGATRKVIERPAALDGAARRPSVAGRLGRHATLSG